VSGVGYACGLAIERQHQQSHQKKTQYLWLGIVSMLLVLGYFKYANFFIDNASILLGLDVSHLNIILPVGLSFFTFQVISYLVDVWRGEIRACEKRLLFIYCIFPAACGRVDCSRQRFFTAVATACRFKLELYLLGSTDYHNGCVIICIFLWVEAVLVVCCEFTRI